MLCLAEGIVNFISGRFPELSERELDMSKNFPDMIVTIKKVGKALFAYDSNGKRVTRITGSAREKAFEGNYPLGRFLNKYGKHYWRKVDPATPIVKVSRAERQARKEAGRIQARKEAPRIRARKEARRIKEEERKIQNELEKEKREQIRCIMCGSTELTAQKKGFGLGKALVGGLTLGPGGLLGGFLGSKKIKITCLKCGNTWKPGKC